MARIVIIVALIVWLFISFGCGFFSLASCTDEEAGACLADESKCDPCFVGSRPANGATWSIVDED